MGAAMGSDWRHDGVATVLGIWAHPDDEVFVSGGLMAEVTQRGGRAVCMHMTRGEAGLAYRRQCRPETLAVVRERELEDSLAHIGVEEQWFLDYPDGGLPAVPRAPAIARIHDALVKVRPDAVVTFGPDGFTGHPDHKVLSGWVTAAFGQWNDPYAHLYYATVSPEWKDAFAPALDEFEFFWPGHPAPDEDADLTLTLDQEALSAKVESLRAHASQMSVFFDAYGDDFMRQVSCREHFSLATPVRRGACGSATQCHRFPNADTRS